MEKLKVGIVSISQLSFSGDKVAAYKNSLDEMLIISKEMGFDLFIYDEAVIDDDGAKIAVRTIENQKVDFLLVQHTSFSAGSLAVIFGKIKNARLAFWAIREGAEAGPVPFNSFCSINMHQSIVHHYLKDLNIKVKWFYGNPSEDQFKKRLLVTIRALKTIKNMQYSKIALVGGIATGFNDLYNDERQFLRLFDGLEYNRQHEYDELKSMAIAISDNDAQAVVKKMIAKACGVGVNANETLLTSAKFYLAYKKFIEINKYNAIAISCWPKFQADFKYSVCSVVAQLNDDGIPIACEGDTLSAISMLILKYLSDDDTMLMDMSNFDENDNSVLMWHCGPAAARFGEKYTLSVNYTGMPHQLGEPLNTCGVVRDMVFTKMPVTSFRLSGECDRYINIQGRFIGDTKKSFYGSRGWMDSLKINGEDINVKDLVNTILVTGFQHHYPIVAGDYDSEIKELAAWLGLKPIEKVAYADHLQIV